MHKTIEPGRQPQANELQIPIAQSKQNRNINICSAPAVSSTEDYPTPAPNADLIRKPWRAGRHLIILNRSGHRERQVQRIVKRRFVESWLVQYRTPYTMLTGERYSSD